MSLTAIILAAGKSTRMKSKRPKALHEVCGKPMLRLHPAGLLRRGRARACIVVVGHGKDEVIGAVRQRQADRAGSSRPSSSAPATPRGCASRSCKKLHGDVFILAGDGPLIRGEVLHDAAAAPTATSSAAASMATAVLDDPTGYGRIVRDDDGEFVEIVEQVDARPSSARSARSSRATTASRSRSCCCALSKLKNENKKGEYYLTDIYGILRSAGQEGRRGAGGDAEDVLALNTRAAARRGRRGHAGPHPAAAARGRRDDRQRRSTRTSRPA